MKRFKIWLKSFTLIQQFLTVVFFTIIVLAFFVVAFLNRNIDNFVNDQMLQNIHNGQIDFLNSRIIDNESNSIVN